MIDRNREHSDQLQFSSIVAMDASKILARLNAAMGLPTLTGLELVLGRNRAKKWDAITSQSHCLPTVS